MIIDTDISPLQLIITPLDGAGISLIHFVSYICTSVNGHKSTDLSIIFRKCLIILNCDFLMLRSALQTGEYFRFSSILLKSLVSLTIAAAIPVNFCIGRPLYIG